jgi:hypothetical protein
VQAFYLVNVTAYNNLLQLLGSKLDYNKLIDSIRENICSEVWQLTYA